MLQSPMWRFVPGNTRVLGADRLSAVTMHTVRWLHGSVVVAVLIVLVWALGAGAQLSPFSAPSPGQPGACGPPIMKKKMIEARPTYYWGMDETWFRDPNNTFIRSAKMEMTLNSKAVGGQGEFFPMKDLAVRAQGWINFPEKQVNDLLFEGFFRSFETKPEFLSLDVSGIYHLGLSGMPYTSGLILGYRYFDYNYRSDSTWAPNAFFDTKKQMHIPYLGAYYAHTCFLGAVVRFDFCGTPLVISRFNADADWPAADTNIRGESNWGMFLDSYLQFSWGVGDSFLFGIFGRHNYTEINGRANIDLNALSTDFTMESHIHNFFAGLSATFTF